MTIRTGDLHDSQFTYVAAYVSKLDPSATDAAIRRYLAEIETMVAALDTLDAPATMHTEPFTAEWPDGDEA